MPGFHWNDAHHETAAQRSAHLLDSESSDDAKALALQLEAHEGCRWY
jgi:hypothetical protein